jgi:iron complex outermembrane receptor protein
VLFNADKAKAYGFEADMELRPIPNLTLSAGLSLLHSEIKDKRVYAGLRPQRPGGVHGE